MASGGELLFLKAFDELGRDIRAVCQRKSQCVFNHISDGGHGWTLRGFGRFVLLVFRLLGGMGAAVYVLELLDAHLGVNGGRFELLVAEELLDEADVGSAFEHVRGAKDGSFRGGRCRPF